MKKTALMLAVLMLAAFAFAGCSSPAATDATPAPDATEAPATTDAPAEGDASSSAVDAIKAKGELVMLTNAAFPPFEYLGADNNVVGVDVDIAQAVADELGVALKVVDMDFDGIVPAIQTGKGDLGVAGMTATEERMKTVDFSINYVDAAQVIIVRADDTSIAGAADLEGKNVGVQNGTTGDLYVTDETGANPYRYKTGADAAIELTNGKLDAVVLDEMPANEIVASNSALKVLDEPLTEEQYAIAIAKGKDDLKAVVDSVVAKLLEEGKIDEWIEAHKQASETLE